MMKRVGGKRGRNIATLLENDKFRRCVMNVIYVLVGLVDEMEFRTRVEFLTMINVVCVSVCAACLPRCCYTGPMTCLP